MCAALLQPKYNIYTFNLTRHDLWFAAHLLLSAAALPHIIVSIIYLYRSHPLKASDIRIHDVNHPAVFSFGARCRHRCPSARALGLETISFIATLCVCVRDSVFCAGAFWVCSHTHTMDMPRVACCAYTCSCTRLDVGLAQHTLPYKTARIFRAFAYAYVYISICVCGLFYTVCRCWCACRFSRAVFVRSFVWCVRSIEAFNRRDSLLQGSD